MTHFIKSAKYILACIVVSLFVSCSSPEEKFISNLTDLTERIEDHGKDFSAEDWEKVYDKYTALMDKSENLNFSKEQQREIGKLQGRCLAGFGKAMGSQVGSFFEGLTSGAAGFFDGLQESLGIKDSSNPFDEASNAVKEGLDEASSALKDSWGEASSSVKEGVDEIKENAKDAWKEAKDAMGEEAKGAVDEVKNALKGLLGD